MKKLKYLSVILLVALGVSLAASPAAMALDDPDPAVKSAVVLDLATGNPVYVKNADDQVYPASLTKIMTVLLAVEAIERGDVAVTDQVTASATSGFDLIDDGSTAGIVVGETMTLENLLYCAMIQSANEACNIIAEHISGSISAFVERMNARAQELGCTGTNFANTHGLPNNSHHTTATDFGKISYEATHHPLFMEICSTPKITIPATNKSEARNLSNTNGLMNPESVPYSGYLYEGASGIKTGHTDSAGYCLASTVTRNGVGFITIVMGGSVANPASGATYGNFTESIKLYDWAFANFSYRDILKITDLVEDIPVEMGSDADIVTVHPQKAIQILLPNDDDLTSFVQKTTIYTAESKEKLVAPIQAGQVLGEINIERDGVSYGSSLLVASTSVDLSYSSFIKGRIANTLKSPLVIVTIIIILALLAGYIFLVVRYRNTRKKALAGQTPEKTGSSKIFGKRKPVKSTSAGSRGQPEPSIQYFDNSEDFYEDLPPETSNPEDAPPISPDQAERDYFEDFFGKK